MASRYDEPYRGLPAEIRLIIWGYFVPKQIEVLDQDPEDSRLKPFLLLPPEKLEEEDELDYNLLLLDRQIYEECLPLYQAIEFSYSLYNLIPDTNKFISFVQRRLAMGSPIRCLLMQSFHFDYSTLNLLQDSTATTGRALRLLCVENWPDHVTLEEIKTLRRCGETYVVEEEAELTFDIGVKQSIADKVEITFRYISDAAKQYLAQYLNQHLTSLNSKAQETKGNCQINMKWIDRPANRCDPWQKENLPRLRSVTIEFSK